jgi:hypothetical protein
MMYKLRKINCTGQLKATAVGLRFSSLGVMKEVDIAATL